MLLDYWTVDLMTRKYFAGSSAAGDNEGLARMMADVKLGWPMP
jgi:hypothetical protein